MRERPSSILCERRGALDVFVLETGFILIAGFLNKGDDRVAWGLNFKTQGLKLHTLGPKP